MSNDRIVAALKPAVLDEPPADMDTRIAAIVATPRRTPAARTRKPLGLVASGAAATAIVATALAVTVVATGGDGKRSSPGSALPTSEPTSPAPVKVQTAALTFTKTGGYLTVRVKDPAADPARYKKEFAAHGLDVDLQLAPRSRREAGSVVFLEDDGGSGVKMITALGHCGTRNCPVGIKIPRGYKGFVRVVFGRIARPGEHYITGPLDTPGEGVGLSDVENRTVADVLAEAKRKHIGTISYRYEDHGSDKPYSNGLPADKVQGNWYVHDAVAGTGGEVIIFVGPHRATYH